MVEEPYYMPIRSVHRELIHYGPSSWRACLAVVGSTLTLPLTILLADVDSYHTFSFNEFSIEDPQIVRDGNRVRNMYIGGRKGPRRDRGCDQQAVIPFCLPELRPCHHGA